MLFHKDNIQAFRHLLDTQPELFSKYAADLERLRATLPGEVEQISEAIAAWYEPRLQICDAMLALLSSSSDRGAFPNTIHPIDPKEWKTLVQTTIQNHLRQSPLQSPPPKPKLSSKPNP